MVPVAFSIMPMNSGKDFKGRETDVAQPVMATGPAGGNQGGDYVVQPSVAYPLQEIGKRTGVSTTDVRAGVGIGNAADPMFTLQAGAQHGVAFMENQRGEVRQSDVTNLTVGGGKPGQGYPAALVGSAVRRLTPRECERLQGFPDDFTLVPHRGKPAADGPRYKALGNSMAVPCMAWIGQRIAAVEALPINLAVAA
jgi:DNA (cytosine-5)-methyltransferase 1